MIFGSSDPYLEGSFLHHLAGLITNTQCGPPGKISGHPCSTVSGQHCSISNESFLIIKDL